MSAHLDPAKVLDLIESLAWGTPVTRGTTRARAEVIQQCEALIQAGAEDLDSDEPPPADPALLALAVDGIEAREDQR